ncbi:MAG TPA: Wzz/FepE/Etk N-terminal domain-containing protein, partial [Polyangiales bacterium]|nr:Wzz/FepE/Etk N-terminal domain-containing protein [Polyangiales bacterium]
MDQYDSDDEYKGRPGVPVDLGRLIQALRRHWRAIPTCVAIGALAGLAVAALFVKPSYTARATILWEPSASADPSDRSFLTQVDSIKLTSNLKEVKRRLHLKPSVDDLKEKLNLLFDGQSHLVVVEATDPTSKGAVQLANTTVDVFLDYQRSIGRDRGSEHLKRLDGDILASQAQLRNARESYDVFRRELSVADFEVELKLALQKVSDIKQQIELSGAEAMTEEARQRSMSQEALRQPITSIAATSMSNPDAIALANLQTQLVSARSHLSPDHPDVLRLEAQVTSLQQRVKTTPTMVQGAINVTQNAQHVALEAGISQSKVSREALLEKQAGLKRLLEDAEQRLAQLSGAQGRAQQLLSAIASEEAHKNELEALRVRTADQVRSAAADFRVVTPATTPDKPNPSARRAIAVRFPLG